MTGQAMHWGVNCEASEDDCTSDTNPCLVQPGTTCTECARMVQPPTGGFAQPNPDCPMGYTCDAVMVSPSCVDDAVCTSYATLFGYATAARAGPCSSWPPQQMTLAVATLQPPLPVGATLETLCPQSCQSCAPATPSFVGVACASSPCKNGGSCADRVDGSYTCRCALSPETGQPMFWGANCETSEDDCTLQNVSCSATPRSVCVDCARQLPNSNPFVGLVLNPDCPNGYMCECPVGMEGRECAIDIDECASTPCQNGGACADSSIDVSIATGKYKCSCTLDQFTQQPTHWGVNCETSEDDCTLFGGGPCLSQPGTTCVDCARMIVGTGGFVEPNPDCPMGYTCNAPSGLPVGGDACTDDPVCAAYSTIFEQATAAGYGPCASWSPAVMTSVAGGLAPLLPLGTSLDELCPKSCEACQMPTLHRDCSVLRREFSNLRRNEHLLALP